MDFSQNPDTLLNDLIAVIRKHELDDAVKVPDFILAVYLSDTVETLKKYQLLSGGLAIAPPKIEVNKT